MAGRSVAAWQSARGARLGGSGFGLARGALFGFLEAVALAFEGDNLGTMDEAVDEGDSAGGVGEDLVPFAERLVGGQEDGTLLFIAA